MVREAAACGLASVLVEGSCAAEGVTHGKNALLVHEDPASLAVCLAMNMSDSNRLRNIGENSCRDLYISWETAVKKAADGYGTVIERFNSGKYPKRNDLADSVLHFEAMTLDAGQRIHDHIMSRIEHMSSSDHTEGL